MENSIEGYTEYGYRGAEEVISLTSENKSLKEEINHLKETLVDLRKQLERIKGLVNKK